MDTNQMILIAIIILSSIIVIFGGYFLVVFLINKNREKKVKTIFDPSNLVEEESLMNVMDEKRNLEYKTPDTERFVNDAEEVKVVTSQALSREEKVNPFGVDMTMRTKDNTKIELNDANNQNKFIK